MALLETYGAVNRVIDQGKCVAYNKTKTFNQYTYSYGVSQEITIGEEWEYTRNCSKSYRYVGMTRAAARECAEDMIAYYTRATKVSVWNASGTTAGTFTEADGGNQQMAEVAVIHDSGCMYHVQINVKETDTRISTFSRTAASFFTAEDAREYDEGEEES